MVDLLSKWTWVMELSRDPGLSRGDLAVGIAIADYFNDKEGYAWPSQATIAARALLSVRAVRKSIGRLTKRKWLEIIRRGSRSGSARYRPCFERAASLRNGASSYRAHAGWADP